MATTELPRRVNLDRIGGITRACEAGRADARRGMRRRWASMDHRFATFYFDGWRREYRAMVDRGECPQRNLFDAEDE